MSAAPPAGLAANVRSGTVGPVELLRFPLTGRAVRVGTEGSGAPAEAVGVLGVDVAPTTIDDRPYVVVQVLFDDGRPTFDRGLLDEPLVAELVDSAGHVTLREPFDHDQFRRTLQRERHAGQETTRGVLILTHGELPPPWIRLAFLPLDLAQTEGSTLVVRRTTLDELLAGVDASYEAGEIGDDERRALVIAIEQRLPRR